MNLAQIKKATLRGISKPDFTPTPDEAKIAISRLVNHLQGAKKRGDSFPTAVQIFSSKLVADAVIAHFKKSEFFNVAAAMEFGVSDVNFRPVTHVMISEKFDYQDRYEKMLKRKAS